MLVWSSIFYTAKVWLVVERRADRITLVNIQCTPPSAWKVQLCKCSADDRHMHVWCWCGATVPNIGLGLGLQHVKLAKAYICIHWYSLIYRTVCQRIINIAVGYELRVALRLWLSPDGMAPFSSTMPRFPSRCRNQMKRRNYWRRFVCTYRRCDRHCACTHTHTHMHGI